ncbi:vacuolar protein-sorting protein-like protein [Dermatophagoides farinae]|uniref:Vacuolar protein-sorting protein-like protein n=1 Tax=Dermatophagoides farinae TaxID=6954 RepID=A0A9D4SJ86_DERFA|nr:vacuolar protein-sorting protein-like protein [Dermatophagoides farinae]
MSTSFHIDGSKDIVLGGLIVSIIDLICSYTSMKEVGVEKIYKINNIPTATNKKLCFIIQSNINDVKQVCNWLNVFHSKDIQDIQYWIIFVPKKTFDCEKYLEKEGLYSCFNIWEYPLGFIPFDNDLFSLEQKDLYHDYLLLGDHQFLNNVVQAMHHFQRLFGHMNLVITKGRASEFICNNLQKLNAFSGVIDDSSRDCLIDLFVFDREEDYVALLLSQLNYSGIIDETFSINCGKIPFNPDDCCNQKQDVNSIKHNLLKNDQIFADVQDKFFSSVCSTLKEKGQKLRQKSYERQTMNLSEMKNFLTKEISNLQSEHKLLFSHLTICESIMEKKKLTKFSDQLRIEQNMIEGIESRTAMNFIEDGIIKLLPETQMLRLICLYSICYSGISNKELNNLIRLYTQSYGHHHITTFYYLKKIGILYESTNQFNLIASSTAQKLAATTLPLVSSSTSETIKKFRHIVKKSNLIPLLETEHYNPRVPTDCGYVYGGSYCPYICKLMQNFFDTKNLSQIEEWCKQNHCKLQPNLLPNQHVGRDWQSKAKRIQMILFAGGITYAEISSLRFLSKQISIPIIIMASSIINGNTFLRLFSDKLFY